MSGGCKKKTTVAMFNPDNYDTVSFFFAFQNILEFNQCLINGKHGQGTLSTKISADKSA